MSYLQIIVASNWKKYTWDFLSIFVAVIAAFALNNWNDNRRDAEAKDKILMEIANGLEKDSKDLEANLMGHEMGIKSVQYWQDWLDEKPVNKDSLFMHFFSLTRDYFLLQNMSGYEALKTKGLELIEDDTLRHSIIDLYEYDYRIGRYLEEDYAENQFHKSYFNEVNQLLAPYLEFGPNGFVSGLNPPLKLSEAEKNQFRTILFKIRLNRGYTLVNYKNLKRQVANLQEDIKNYVLGINPDEFDLIIQRSFAAHPNILFEYFVDTTRMRTWWTETTEFEIDPKVGGEWKIVRTDGDEVYTALGEYLEVDQPVRLVYTHKMPQFSDNSDTVFLDIQFNEMSGCNVIFRQSGPDIEAELAALKADEKTQSEHGWNEAFDLIEADLLKQFEKSKNSRKKASEKNSAPVQE